MKIHAYSKITKHCNTRINGAAFNPAGFGRVSFEGMPVKKAVIVPFLLLLPMKTGEFCARQLAVKTEKIIAIAKKEILKEFLDKLNVIEETNFRGGKICRYDSVSIEKLKKELKTTDTVFYSLPIENTPNVYLSGFGFFGAKRPGGRPHMGLDIFVSPYGKKPKIPVSIHAPIDGVVIASKKANEKDNIIANSITILGVDGRKYAFDHMARREDYPKAKELLLPSVGQVIKAGDELGYVGHTGETELWHLHLTVMTDEGLARQLLDDNWRALSKKSPYTSLKGQVDPLSEADAGAIANLLNQYKKTK